MRDAQRKPKNSARPACRMCGQHYARGAAGEMEGLCSGCFERCTETPAAPAVPAVILLDAATPIPHPAAFPGASGSAGHYATRQGAAPERAVLGGGRERRG